MNEMILLPDNYHGHKVYHEVHCRVCDTITKLTLPFSNFQEWRSGTYVQDAFTYLTNAQREMIVSGTHSDCFDNLFPEE